MNMTLTDELLMAHADGALEPEAAEAVALAMAADPAVAARVEAFRQTRELAAAVALPPVPDALRDSVMQIAARHAAQAQTAAAAPQAPLPAAAADNVVSLASRRQPMALWQPALAASIALALGVGIGAFGIGGSRAPVSLAALDDAAISDNLGRLASGTSADLPGGGAMMVVSTFTDGDGAVCREFEHDNGAGRAQVSVACNVAGEWDVRLAVMTGLASDTGYAPASSLAALDAYLAGMEAGAPMDATDEAAALAALR